MPKVDDELFFHMMKKIIRLSYTDKGLQMITRERRRHRNFLLLPDIGVKLADIRKGELSAEEKLQTQRKH